ncbi:MAG: carbohydrate ABC transporter permease [Ardenticatenia bacterium]|nr:carbohydrate ABC transporter permease [Ardenticatenia bacterium]
MTWRQRVGKAIPYVLLIISIIPITVGYLWLLISPFSTKTEGLRSMGWTLSNWSFLWKPPFGLNYPSIWRVTLNTFMVATSMAVFVVLISSLAGYPLSRLKFVGRRSFLSLTLIVHAFPSVTLLIPIYFVLRFLHLFNTMVGVALVMVAFQLPFGVWLMKGFFDNVSWDMERAALIDGASRFRVWWQIIIPTIKPGLAALAIFAFLSGWNAYLIPFTFTIGRAGKTAVLSVYLQNFQGDTVMTNWNMVTAVGLFQLIPVMFFFIFTQEYLLNIYAGGAKGGA